VMSFGNPWNRAERQSHRYGEANGFLHNLKSILIAKIVASNRS
jgi:hypothetical protein